MQDEKAKEVDVNIESALFSLKEQLFAVEASIRYAQLELEVITQTIQSLFMQKGMPVCKFQKNKSEDAICTCGEKIDKDYQLTRDPVKIAQDFWLI